MKKEDTTKINSNFLKKISKQGYNYSVFRLGGGFVNQTYLVVTRKRSEHNYVLKFYGTEKEIKTTIKNYNLIHKKIKTPKMVFSDVKNKELVCEHVPSRSIREVIKNKDRHLGKYLKEIALQLRNLHSIYSKKTPWYVLRKDSFDEKKILKHSRLLLKKGKITEKEFKKIKKRIKHYVPKSITLVHGDAHLGNFIATDNKEIFIIDLDEMKYSDPAVDLGKLIHEVDVLCYKAGYSKKRIAKFIKSILETYGKEHIKGVQLFRLRTPLIELKSKHLDSYDVVRYLVRNKKLE